MPEVPEDRIVQFLRSKDFIQKKTLGQGGFGKTVLLFDDIIDEHFVCKKYAPLETSQREEFFSHFVREVKFLHLVHHRNIVRIFNYYLYPKNFAGYIVMEYIEGTAIDKYLENRPEDINEIFEQVIEGFAHLESQRVLHRDIRQGNLLVTDEGTVKIIDFGFAKRVVSQDFSKSISLNWIGESPAEFKDAIYDHRSEVYFCWQTV